MGDVDAIHVLDVGSCNNAAKLQHHDVQHACRIRSLTMDYSGS